MNCKLSVLAGEQLPGHTSGKGVWVSPASPVHNNNSDKSKSESEQMEDAGHGHKSGHHGQSIELDELKWYQPARALYLWGEKRPPKHPGWESLFFDLIYVGVAFSTGGLLADELSVLSVFSFLILFLIFFDAWMRRAFVNALTVSDDWVHYIMNLIQGMLIAFAAYNLDSNIKYAANGQLAALIWARAVHLICVMIPFAELALFGKSMAEQVQGKKWITALLFSFLGNFLAGIVATLAIDIDGSGFTVASDGDGDDHRLRMLAGSSNGSADSALYDKDTSVFVHVLIIVFVGHLLEKSYVNMRVFQGVLDEEKTLPMHLEFMIHRFGEFSMLMLGEGVLQIILVKSVFSAPYHFAFFGAYFVMAMLQLCHYSMIPFTEQDHAMRKSRKRGQMWLEILMLYSAMQVAAGVALKVLLGQFAALEAEYIGDGGYPDEANYTAADRDERHLATVSYDSCSVEDDSHRRRLVASLPGPGLIGEYDNAYVWLLAISLSVLVLLLVIQNMLHAGVHDFFGLGKDYDSHASKPFMRRRRTRKRIPKIAMVVSAIILACLPVMLANTSQPQGILIWSSTLCLAVVAGVRVVVGSFDRDRKLRHTIHVSLFAGKLRARAKATKARLLLQRQQKQEASMSGGAIRTDEVDLGTVKMNGMLGVDEVESANVGFGLASSSTNSSSSTATNSAEVSAPKRISFATEDSEGAQVKDSVNKAKPRSRSGSASTLGSKPIEKLKSKTFAEMRLQSSGVYSTREVEAARGKAKRKRRAVKHAFRLRLAKFSKLSRSVKLYSPPKCLLDWEESVVDREVQWGDLFFDLVYVAVLFKLGSMLLFRQRGAVVLWFYSNLFLALYECWEDKTSYASRFATKDVAHKLFDLVQGLSVALAASYILSVCHFTDKLWIDPMLHEGETLAFGFTTCLMVYHFFRTLIWIEVASKSVKKNAQALGRRMVCVSLVKQVPLAVNLALIGRQDVPAAIIAALWGLNLALSKAGELFLAWRGVSYSKEASLPIHVEYTVHRYGEWLMLMLGEGVMQLIISTPQLDTDHPFIFLAGYMVLAALRTHHFQVEGVDDHALNDPLRRVFWSIFIAFESLAIVCVGAILVQILSSNVSAARYLYNALAASCCLTMMCISGVDFCHFVTIRMLYNARWMALSLSRGLVIFAFFASFGFDETVPEVFVAYIAVIIIVAIFIHVKVQRFREGVVNECTLYRKLHGTCKNKNSDVNEANIIQLDEIDKKDSEESDIEQDTKQTSIHLAKEVDDYSQVAPRVRLSGQAPQSPSLSENHGISVSLGASQTMMDDSNENLGSSSSTVSNV